MQDYEAKKVKTAAAVAELVAKYPMLVTAAATKGGGLQAAAKNIRIELKAAFPAIKFSVKSSRFSMGDSIDVSWTDGPMTAQVEAIIKKYAAGSFNGMEDIYEYASSAWTNAFGDAKYVHSQRSLSDAAVASAIRTAVARGMVDDTATVAAYRKGSLMSVSCEWGGRDVQDVIASIAYGRTWALTKALIVQSAA